MLDERDSRFQCRGDCGDWSCGGVKVGQLYEVAGVFKKVPDRVGRLVYQLVPEGLRLIEDNNE
jgi:hypothetical protein